MWPEFEQMSVEVQKNFIEIVEDELVNGKEDRLIREIENFLLKLFKMIYKKRISYLSRNV